MRHDRQYPTLLSNVVRCPPLRQVIVSMEPIVEVGRLPQPLRGQSSYEAGLLPKSGATFLVGGKVSGSC